MKLNFSLPWHKPPSLLSKALQQNPHRSHIPCGCVWVRSMKTESCLERLGPEWRGLTQDREVVCKWRCRYSEPEGTERTLIHMRSSEIIGGAFNLDGRRLRETFGVAVVHGCYLGHSKQPASSPLNLWQSYLLSFGGTILSLPLVLAVPLIRIERMPWAKLAGTFHYFETHDPRVAKQTQINFRIFKKLFGKQMLPFSALELGWYEPHWGQG